MSCRHISIVGDTYRSSRRSLSTMVALASLAVAFAIASTGQPMGIFDLRAEVGSAQVIVSGTFLKWAPGPAGPRASGVFLVQRVIKGRVPRGEIIIDLGPPNQGSGFPGQPEVALLDRDAKGRLRPAGLGEWRGFYAFLPAMLRSGPARGGPLAEVVKEVGDRLLDASAPLEQRVIALQALSGEPSARPFLEVAARNHDPRIGYQASAELISGGDLGALRQAAADLAAHPPSPSQPAANLAIAIASFSSPSGIPALEKLARSGPPELRIAALRGLGATRSPSAIPALRRALRSPTYIERYWAVYGLSMIAGEGPVSEAKFRAHEASILRGWLSRPARGGR